MSAACTVRMMAGRVGAARSAMRRRRSIYAASAALPEAMAASRASFEG